MNKSVKYMEWSDNLSVGIKIVDKQHKHFIGIMDKLFKAIQTDKKDAVSKIIDELVEYADMHFATEQEIFKKFNYEEADQHIAEHREIQDKIAVFTKRKDEDPFGLGYDLLDLLDVWMTDHLSKMDKKYAKVLKQRGLS